MMSLPTLLILLPFVMALYLAGVLRLAPVLRQAPQPWRIAAIVAIYQVLTVGLTLISQDPASASSLLATTQSLLISTLIGLLLPLHVNVHDREKAFELNERHERLLQHTGQLIGPPITNATLGWVAILGVPVTALFSPDWLRLLGWHALLVSAVLIAAFMVVRHNAAKHGIPHD